MTRLDIGFAHFGVFRRMNFMGCGVFAAVAILLGGCSTVGDFGRPKESLVVTESLKNYDKLKGIISSDHSSFALTRHEIDIRKAAYHFHQPLPSGLLPTRIANMIRRARLNTLSDFADGQSSRGHIDGNSRAGEIDELLAADHLWLKRFGRSARLIRGADRERLIILEQDPGAFSDDDRINTHARIRENADIMLAVLVDLDRRVAAYHYAIQRTRLEWPQTPLARTETSFSQLRERSALLRVELGFDGGGIDFEEIETIEQITPTGPRPPKMAMPETYNVPGQLPSEAPPQNVSDKSFRNKKKAVIDKANVMPGFEDPLR